MKMNWHETPLPARLATVASLVVALAVIVLAILQIFQVWAFAPYLYMPLMGVSLLLQAYTQWKHSRGVAIFSLCAAAFVFICTVAVCILS